MKNTPFWKHIQQWRASASRANTVTVSVSPVLFDQLLSTNGSFTTPVASTLCHNRYIILDNDLISRSSNRSLTRWCSKNLPLNMSDLLIDTLFFIVEDNKA